MPDTMQPAPLPSVYQLRVVVRGVSPLIWRRLLIAADTTIAGLHAVLQIAFGWTGTHLHRFVVQGREYGIGYPGGPNFRDDPRKVPLVYRLISLAGPNPSGSTRQSRLCQRCLLPTLTGISRIRLRSAPTRLLRQPGEEVSHLLRSSAPVTAHQRLVAHCSKQH